MSKKSSMNVLNVNIQTVSVEASIRGLEDLVKALARAGILTRSTFRSMADDVSRDFRIWKRSTSSKVNSSKQNKGAKSANDEKRTKGPSSKKQKIAASRLSIAKKISKEIKYGDILTIGEIDSTQWNALILQRWPEILSSEASERKAAIGSALTELNPSDFEKKASYAIFPRKLTVKPKPPVETNDLSPGSSNRSSNRSTPEKESKGINPRTSKLKSAKDFAKHAASSGHATNGRRENSNDIVDIVEDRKGCKVRNGCNNPTCKQCLEDWGELTDSRNEKAKKKKKKSRKRRDDAYENSSRYLGTNRHGVPIYPKNWPYGGENPF